jgi:thymidylate synthase
MWGGDMEIERESLDAVLFELYNLLLSSDGRNEGTRGATREMLGVTLRITNPRARLSRSENRGKPFSALGELLWYLSKSDKLEFIEPYVPRYKQDAVDGVLPGAYGPRFFGMRAGIDQFENITALLSDSPSSRRAVVQLFNAEDIVTRLSEIPCTTTLQFFVRENRLTLSVTMRSNDAYWGLPHDVFCFTMIQEMMASRLKIDLGEYYHYVGSMHIYDKYKDEIENYLNEGHQRCLEMPAMPQEDAFKLIPELLQVESETRKGNRLSASVVFSTDYWADIVRLIQVFWANKHGWNLDEIRSELVNPIYRIYLDGRRDLKARVASA